VYICSMDSNKALEILQKYIDRRIDATGTFTLPIVDEIVYTEMEGDEHMIEQYSFNYLIAMAYPLTKLWKQD